jgi:toxin ParE1/3/4
MTGRPSLSPRARHDLAEIWDYTQGRWSADQAETYIRNLQRDMDTVAAQPNVGRACSEIRSGYFRFQTGSHVMFYTLIPDGIAVIRIPHERMDFRRHM